MKPAPSAPSPSHASHQGRLPAVTARVRTKRHDERTEIPQCGSALRPLRTAWNLAIELATTNLLFVERQIWRAISGVTFVPADGFAIWREDQARVVAYRGAVNPLVRRAVGGFRGDRTGRVRRKGRRVEHVEAQPVGGLAQREDFVGRERGLLQQKCLHAIVLDDGEA
jgi:hypothetical protein